MIVCKLTNTPCNSVCLSLHPKCESRKQVKTSDRPIPPSPLKQDIEETEKLEQQLKQIKNTEQEDNRNYHYDWTDAFSGAPY